MHVVFYDPHDGRITATMTARRELIEAQGRPFVEVEQQSDDFDATHRVQDGKVVEIAA